MRAPRLLACSSSSRITMPDPSASTNPSRFLSNGRDAAGGLSFRVLRDLAAQNEASPMGVTAASEPPVTWTSLRP